VYASNVAAKTVDEAEMRRERESKMESMVISSKNAPRPVGPYSQGVRRGNILAVGGQVGSDPKSGILCEGAHEQIRQALANVQAVLEEAGASFADVVILHFFLTEEGHFRVMNEVLEQFAKEPFPARTTVYTELSPGMFVQVDALAVVE
jgi:reactive intermediate/imine deaminase